MDRERCRFGVFALSLAAAALVPVAAAARDGAVSGAVTDTTGLALPGVTVEARGTTGGPALTAATDGAGEFTIAGLEAGTYELAFTLPGFQTVVRAVTVGAGAAATVDVEMAVELAERVVVVGSRARPRSVTESPVPIDAIPFRDVANQGAAPLDYRLRTLVPSFNVATHPISGAASLVRPASEPAQPRPRRYARAGERQAAAPLGHPRVVRRRDRRHAGARPLAHSVHRPRQVEVLRDGASAQYGSDAIAGVMNFLLKDDRAGGSMEVGTGGYRASDGGAWNAASNVGLPLGDTGFANLSFEYGDAGATDRSVQRADAAALIEVGVGLPAQALRDFAVRGEFPHCPIGPQVLNTLRRYGRHRLSRLRRTGTTPHIASVADAGEIVAVLLADSSGRVGPRIRFLSIGSRLCSALPSDPASRRRPLVSLILRRHQAG